MIRAVLEVRTNGVKLAYVTRSFRNHAGWLSAHYAGKRFQVLGGIRGTYWIETTRPIAKAVEMTP